MTSLYLASYLKAMAMTMVMATTCSSFFCYRQEYDNFDFPNEASSALCDVRVPCGVFGPKWGQNRPFFNG